MAAMIQAEPTTVQESFVHHLLPETSLKILNDHHYVKKKEKERADEGRRAA